MSLSPGIKLAEYEILAAIGAGGMALEELTSLASEKGDKNQSTPKFLPDGKNVVLTVVRAEGPMIGVASLETSEYQALLDGSHPHYVSTGHLIFVRSGRLLAVPFDLDRLEITGTPVPVLDGISTILWGGLKIGRYGISETGSLLYAPGVPVITGRQNRLLWVERDGRSSPLTEQMGNYLSPRLSPDGRRPGCIAAD